ncbi:hypothetical protein V1264_003748 [Littorina saxatilis]|uniref:Uncharacterized protein n=1 Tax=Littorina saxatilis TaxID=31220 RepID=A0AAN9B371_9CAEN
MTAEVQTSWATLTSDRRGDITASQVLSVMMIIKRHSLQLHLGVIMPQSSMADRLEEYWTLVSAPVKASAG